MAIWHRKSRRKRSSGKFRPHSKRKKAHLGGEFTETTLGERKIVKSRTRGGNIKERLKKGDSINLSIPEKGETRKVEIQDVLKNNANSDFVRRDILTKGTIIKTEEGNARITSRPGQDGMLNAVLMEE